MAKRKPVPFFKQRFRAFDGPKHFAYDSELKLYHCELGTNVAVGLDPWQRPEQHIAGESYTVTSRFVNGVGATAEEAVLSAFKKLDEIPPHQRLGGA